MIRAEMASTSTACSAEKNSNLAGAPDCAAARACAAAESIAGMFAEIQAAEIPVRV
jgi:hypothetical protein